MSLLLEALKKAEKAKEEAQRRAVYARVGLHHLHRRIDGRGLGAQFVTELTRGR